MMKGSFIKTCFILISTIAKTVANTTPSGAESIDSDVEFIGEGGWGEESTNRHYLRRNLPKADKCTICHKGIETITVNCNALEKHLAHGDTIEGECRKLTCAEQCNHQNCLEDFAEDPLTGTCTCIEESPNPIGCGVGATCNVLTDECECPEPQERYFFDVNGDCVIVPDCTNTSRSGAGLVEVGLSYGEPQEDEDGSEDPCPDRDCLVAYPYSENPGAVIPFSEFNSSIGGWGFVIDITKACPDGLTDADSEGFASCKCILPLYFSTDGTYQGLMESAHLNVWLFSNQLSFEKANKFIDVSTGLIRTSNAPRSSDGTYNVEHLRWYSSVDDTVCTLSFPSTTSPVFTGRNIRSFWGNCTDPNNDSCGNIRVGTVGLRPPQGGFMTLQVGLDVRKARPLSLISGDCPCWDNEGINPLPNTISSPSCTWMSSFSGTFQDRITMYNDGDQFMVTIYDEQRMECLASPYTQQLPMSITNSQFLACADQMVKHCNDLGLRGGPLTEYY